MSLNSRVLILSQCWILTPKKNRNQPTRVHKMSNTVVNGEVIYDFHRLLALFVRLFQTARRLYFLQVGGGYSQTGAYSWRRDTIENQSTLVGGGQKKNSYRRPSSYPGFKVQVLNGCLECVFGLRLAVSILFAIGASSRWSPYMGMTSHFKSKKGVIPRTIPTTHVA